MLEYRMIQDEQIYGSLVRSLKSLLVKCRFKFNMGKHFFEST
jgi:hypothetical protein